MATPNSLASVLEPSAVELVTALALVPTAEHYHHLHGLNNQLLYEFEYSLLALYDLMKHHFLLLFLASDQSQLHFYLYQMHWHSSPIAIEDSVIVHRIWTNSNSINSRCTSIILVTCYI